MTRVGSALLRVLCCAPPGLRAHACSPRVPAIPAAASYLRRLALAINTALNMAGGMSAAAAAAAASAAAADATAGQQQQPQLPPQQQQWRGGGGKQHVADLLLVRARPMYGFYAEEALFVKVLL